MANYHLVHIVSKGTFFNLTRLEMINKLKSAGDYQNWFCWYPGLANWKLVSQAQEIKEWMSTTWTEDQSMPPWNDLFSRKPGTTENGEFEIPDLNEAPGLTPPPLPLETKPEPKPEFVISGFSGQVFDFDDSAKDKTKKPSLNFESDLDKTLISNNTNISEKTEIVELSTKDFDKTVSGSNYPSLEKTVKVDLSAGEFDKTQTSATPLSFEHTTKVNIANIDTSMEKTDKITKPTHETSTNKIETVLPDFSITKDMTPVNDKNVLAAANAEVAQAANSVQVKKHDRRYPRIKGRLRTIITNKSKAFMTFTKDISLGGIHVENMIPHDILNSEIEVYLSDPSGKKSILFRCHPVGDMSNPCRFSFAKADEKSIQKLGQWLDDLSKAA